MFYVVFFWIACGIVGAALLDSRKRAGTGCLLGLLFGPIGVILAAIMRADRPAAPARSPGVAMNSVAPESPGQARPMRACPECAEMIFAEARKCRYCGSVVAPAPEPLADGPISSVDDPRRVSEGKIRCHSCGTWFDRREESCSKCRARKLEPSG